MTTGIFQDPLYTQPDLDRTRRECRDNALQVNSYRPVVPLCESSEQKAMSNDSSQALK